MKILNVSITLGNPFSERFKNLGCFSGKFTEHKAWELEHIFYSGTLLELECKYGTQEDHAGLELAVGLLGYAISFRIYDTRHWDYENERWMLYHG
jgi:hypothetical protein